MFKVSADAAATALDEPFKDEDVGLKVDDDISTVKFNAARARDFEKLQHDVS